MKKRKLLSWSLVIFMVIMVAEYNASSAYSSPNHIGTSIINKKYGDVGKFVFANEDFPYYKDEHFDRYKFYEERITRKNKETALMIKRSKRIFAVIEPILKKHGVPDDFKYLAVSESGLNKSVVSQASAVGIWQLMSVTAKHFKLEVNSEVDERLNLVKSTEAICKLLKSDKKTFGTWTEALVAFNMGSSALLKFQNAQNNYDNIYSLKMYRESSHAMYKIIAYKELFNNLDKYGYGDVKGENFEVKKVVVTKSIENMEKYAHTNSFDLENLRYYNAWILGNKLTVKKNKSYTLQIIK